MTTLPPTTEMQRAYLQRDAAYQGLFLLGVRTTGIFCRPTCPARKPLPKNVEYFATPQEALRAGYRPCKRCRPLDAEDQPQWLAELLADLERDPSSRITDADLTARGIDPATVRRDCRRRFGMTFQAYSRQRRLAEARDQIRGGKSLDATIFDSGYDSHSGFRDAFARTFGTSPGSRHGEESVFLAWLPSPLGPLMAGATAAGVCMLEFSDERTIEERFATGPKLFGAPVVPAKNEHLERLEAELADYFGGKLKKFKTPLVLNGTPFQQRVWEELCRIPYGETRSYEDIAVAVGNSNGQRAVGTANGRNRIAIVIPCHRVINKGGKLGGYGGGLRRKEFLLELEKAHR